MRMLVPYIVVVLFVVMVALLEIYDERRTKELKPGEINLRQYLGALFLFKKGEARTGSPKRSMAVRHSLMSGFFYWITCTATAIKN